MTECHKCKHQKRIAALQREQARLGELCAACCDQHQRKLARKETLNRQGQCVSSLDSHEDAENILAQSIEKRVDRPYDEPDEAEADVLGIPEDAHEYLLKVLGLFYDLKYDEAGIVTSMMQGQTIQQIADSRGERKQTVLFRWNQLIKRQPAFKAIATGQLGMRVGCGCGRKPKQPAAHIVQPTLFD